MCRLDSSGVRVEVIECKTQVWRGTASVVCRWRYHRIPRWLVGGDFSYSVMNTSISWLRCWSQNHSLCLRLRHRCSVVTKDALLYLLFVCPIQCMALDIYKITWMYVCLSVCLCVFVCCDINYLTRPGIWTQCMPMPVTILAKHASWALTIMPPGNTTGIVTMEHK